MSRIFCEKRCVAYTVNKLLKCIWELRNISKIKTNYNYEDRYATNILNPPLIYSNQYTIG